MRQTKVGASRLLLRSCCHRRTCKPASRFSAPPPAPRLPDSLAPPRPGSDRGTSETFSQHDSLGASGASFSALASRPTCAARDQGRRPGSGKDCAQRSLCPGARLADFVAPGAALLDARHRLCVLSIVRTWTALSLATARFRRRDLLLVGEQIFHGLDGGTCAGCHGANAKGTPLLPDLTAGNMRRVGPRRAARDCRSLPTPPSPSTRTETCSSTSPRPRIRASRRTACPMSRRQALHRA